MLRLPRTAYRQHSTRKRELPAQRTCLGRTGVLSVPCALRVPAVLVVRLELVPKLRLRLARDADGAHHLADLGLDVAEEREETLGVRPLVDDHDLAIRSVEPVRDQAMLHRVVADRLDPIRILGR